MTCSNTWSLSLFVLVIKYESCFYCWWLHVPSVRFLWKALQIVDLPFHSPISLPLPRSPRLSSSTESSLFAALISATLECSCLLFCGSFVSLCSLAYISCFLASLLQLNIVSIYSNKMKIYQAQKFQITCQLHRLTKNKKLQNLKAVNTKCTHWVMSPIPINVILQQLMKLL